MRSDLKEQGNEAALLNKARIAAVTTMQCL